MTTTDDLNAAQLETRRFPIVTVMGASIALLLYIVVVLVAYRSPNYLGQPRYEPSADTPMEKRNEALNRNRSVLVGLDPSVKMSNEKATFDLLVTIKESKNSKHEFGHLPFPVQPRTKEEKSP